MFGACIQPYSLILGICVEYLHSPFHEIKFRPHETRIKPHVHLYHWVQVHIFTEAYSILTMPSWRRTSSTPCLLGKGGQDYYNFFPLALRRVSCLCITPIPSQRHSTPCLHPDERPAWESLRRELDWNDSSLTHTEGIFKLKMWLLKVVLFIFPNTWSSRSSK